MTAGTMKRNILFVDDEPRILESLKRSLTHRMDDWNMTFASNGRAATKAMFEHALDVIVCDVRVLGVHGHALLETCRKSQPNAVRIVVSGASAQDQDLEYGAFAHRYVQKPCTNQTLEEAIDRSIHLKSMLDDEAISKLIGARSDLPAVPRIYLELTQALRNPHVAINELAHIVSQDVALCARLLKVANSAYFGLRRQITSVRHAIVYLGMRIMRQLVFSMEVYSSFPTDFGMEDFTPESMQRHSLLTARIASDLCKPYPHLSEHVFMAAMLHDLGKIVLTCYAPEHLKPLFHEAQREQIPLHVIEERHGVTSHAQVGAYLVGHWGLPYTIVEAIAFHHTPWKLIGEDIDLATLIYISNLLAHNNPERSIDVDYLDMLGVKDRLSEWKSHAAQRRNSFLQELD